MTLAWYIVLMTALALPLAVWFGIQIGMEREKASSKGNRYAQKEA